MTPAKSPTPAEINSNVNQISDYLFDSPTPLLPAQKPTAEQTYLKRLNEQLTTYRNGFLQRSRAL